MPEFFPPCLLRVDHNLEEFSCGNPALDEFLKNHALGKQNAMLSRTYIVESNRLEVVAYYTLAHIVVLQQEAPKKTGRGMPSQIPAILLARLAVDQRFHGKGLGRSLFADAVFRTWAVMKEGAAPVRFFVVDAKDDKAQAFYLGLHMVSSPVNPLRLFLSHKDLRELFDPQ